MPLRQLLHTSSGELQAELQLILNAIVEGLCGLDAQGKVTFCNDALLKMTGFATDELIGNNLHELIHHSWPDGRKYLAEECPLGKALRAGRAMHATREVFWRKDRTCFPVEYWAHPLENSSNSTTSVVTIQDISERERSIATLLENEEKFRRLLTSFPDVAWTSDGERGTIYISPKVEALLGYTKQEFCGGSNLRSGLIHPEDFGRVNRGYRALFEKQSPFDEKYRIRRKDGRWIWIHDRATGTHEENGVLYADGVFTDITQRKQAEAELQSKTAFLEAQANCTIDGILVVDGHGRKLLHNQRFIELFHVPPEILANPNDEPLVHHVAGQIKDRELFLTKIKNAYRTPSEIIRDEIELTDGRVMDRYSAPVVAPEGTYYGRIWTFRDITERKRNEDTLQQLSMAVEQSPVSVMIADPHGNISYVNRRFTECTGYQAEEVLGKNPRLLNAGISPPDLFRDLWSTITRGEEWRGEFCNKKKNGEIYWEASTIRPITNAKGLVTHYLALKQDITESRRAAETLKASEKRYRLLFERNLAGVLRTTVEGKVLECNQAAARMFGYDSPEELATLPITSFYESSADREALVARLRQEKSVTNLEIKFQRKGGELTWAVLNMSLVEDECGTAGIIESTMIDITERKRADEELYESQQMLQSILDTIPQRVFWKDRKGLYLGCNPPFAADAGLTAPAEIVGKSDFDLSWSQVAELYRADDFQVMDQGPAKLNFEERQFRSDGSELWLQTNKLPLRDRNGEVNGVLGTYEDITERKVTEQTLQRSEEKFRELAENIHEVFWMMSPNADQILYVSPAYESVWGSTCESLYRDAMSWTKAIHPEDLERAHALFERQMAGERIESEYRIRTPDGQEKWISDRAFPVRDQSGKIIRVVGIAEEITNRKRQEKTVKDSEARYRQLFERNLAGVYRVTLSGRVLECNQATAQMLGYNSPEEVLAVPVADWYYTASDREAFLKKLESDKVVTNYEINFRRKDGSSFWVIGNMSFVDDPTEANGIIEGTIVEITDRKQAEKELRLTQTSLENSADAVFWMDPEGRIVYANHAACRSLGRTREEFLSLSIPDIDPLFTREVWPGFWKELKASGAKTFETQHQSKDGRIFPVEVTSNYLEFDGREYGFAFVRDISQRRELEGQLRQAQKLEGIGQLAAGIAHEINTPAQFVADNLTFLRDSWHSAHQLMELYRASIQQNLAALPPEIATQVEQAERKCDLEFIVTEVPQAILQSLDGAHRVAEIVRAMKEFSHPDSAEKTATDLNKSIQSTITVARNEWKYIADIAIRLDESLPLVVCYPGDINQVILNLVVNASHAIREKVKDGDKGRITVCTRRRDDVAEISVGDNGTGIPETIRTRIFDPFFTTKEVGKGTGQGLSLAHAIVVKKHGGKIWFETELGVGTTFFIDLPIAPTSREKDD